MDHIDRRAFLTLTTTAASSLHPLLAASGTALVDETLRSGIASRKIPAAVGMVASGAKTLYSGAFGHRDSSQVPVKIDSIFRSCPWAGPPSPPWRPCSWSSKAKWVSISPFSRHLPQFEKIQVLERMDASGKPVLRPPATPPTLRQLLTHTSGLCYDIWDGGTCPLHRRQPRGAHRCQPADVRPRNTLAIRAWPGLGRPPGGEDQRPVTGGLLPETHPAPPGHGRHQLPSCPPPSSTVW